MLLGDYPHAMDYLRLDPNSEVSRAVSIDVLVRQGKLAEVLRTPAAKIPGTFVGFTQGGKTNGCVIVTFSAQAAAAGCFMYVQATLDNTAFGALPLETIFAGFDNWHQATATFIFPSVSPGAHSVQMHFLADNDEGDQLKQAIEWRDIEAVSRHSRRAGQHSPPSHSHPMRQRMASLWGLPAARLCW